MRSLLLVVLAACGSSPGEHVDAPGATGDGPNKVDAGSGSAAARTVFVIPMENKSDAQIFGDTTDAPYINGLLATSAYATNFQDELPSLDSEPHYIWMEAGTNAFADHTFTADGDPTATNSTASTEHLSTQLDAAGLTWVSYNEGIASDTCPIASTGEYAAKHAPFVFFQDVSGSPPSAATAGCKQHHKAMADLAADLQADTVPSYAFVTPDLCDDMHGDLGCPSGFSTPANIKAGDTWLATNLPPLIEFTHSHDAVIFLVWDEGDSSNKIPFIAIGDHVVVGASATAYTHASMLKTEEELFGVPLLATTQGVADLADMFETGYLP